MQWVALEAALIRQRNLYITGPGGVGKSLLTRILLKALNKKYGCVHSDAQTPSHCLIYVS
jgi:DNA replication protein DnaC